MIPAELRALPQWVAWRVESRAGGPTKVPYDPKRPSHRASSTDPATWGTYRQALAVLSADGVGFVFSADDPYCGIDMDKCVSASGRIHGAAHEVVRALNGYVEFSPSGTGLHAIVRGRIARGRHTLKTPWGDEFAVYSAGRFFTMGDDGRGEIRDAQDVLDSLCARFFPEPAASTPVAHPQPFSGDDAELLDRVFNSPSGERIRALWDGDTGEHGGDHSASDLALCRHLAYWTGGDADRMDSLFRRSGLMRDKWDSPRGDMTYGRATIVRAMQGG